jgi:hypothetical protein
LTLPAIIDGDVEECVFVMGSAAVTAEARAEAAIFEVKAGQRYEQV